MAKSSAVRRLRVVERSFKEVYADFQLSNRIKNLSEHTIKSYESNLKSFQQFLEEKEIPFINDIVKADVDSYVLWLKEKKNKLTGENINDTTVNTYLRATRVLLYYCMKEGYIQRFEINLIKQVKTVKETYSEEDIKKLTVKPDLSNCSFTEYRNWVTINYLIDTGNRLNTILHIKVSDVDLLRAQVTLTTTKNRNQQVIPISRALLKVLTEYIKRERLQQNDYLFPSVESNQKNMTRYALEKAIAKYNRNRGVEITSIHAFRHTFASNYIKTGGDAFKLQRWLGHSSLYVTQNYISLFAEDLKEGLENHSILERVNPERIKRSRHR